MNGSRKLVFRWDFVGCGEISGESRIVIGRHESSEGGGDKAW